MQIPTYEEKLSGDFDWALREGSMHFEARNAVHQTLKQMAAKLEELQIPYAVAGGRRSFNMAIVALPKTLTYL